MNTNVSLPSSFNIDRNFELESLEKLEKPFINLVESINGSKNNMAHVMSKKPLIPPILAPKNRIVTHFYQNIFQSKLIYVLDKFLRILAFDDGNN